MRRLPSRHEGGPHEEMDRLCYARGGGLMPRRTYARLYERRLGGRLEGWLGLGPRRFLGRSRLGRRPCLPLLWLSLPLWLWLSIPLWLSLSLCLYPASPASGLRRTATELLVLLQGPARLLSVRRELPERVDEGGSDS